MAAAAGTEPERGQIRDACSILGKKDRTVRALAASGKLPGCARIGGTWTFNLAKLRAYVEFREREAWRSARPQRGVTGAGTRYGAGFRPEAAISDGRYEQTIQKLLSAAARPNVPAR